MSYTPTEWKNGDTITEGKLNKIQEAIENLSMGDGGVEFYDATLTQYSVTVHGLTYRDVRQKMNDGKLVILRGSQTYEPGSVLLYVLVWFSVSGNPEHYGVHGITYNGKIDFTSEDLDDELQLYNGD